MLMDVVFACICQREKAAQSQTGKFLRYIFYNPSTSSTDHLGWYIFPNHPLKLNGALGFPGL